LLENLRKNYPNDLKLEGGFNAQLDKAIDKKELTIKDVKKALGIKDADIAEMFDFKNVMAYRNSSAKPRIEKGIINIYKIIQK
jgi:predicted alpha/beta-fold hydrolase